MKKYTIVLGAALGLALLGQTAFAENRLEFYESFSEEGGRYFVISGSTDAENEEVNILILNPGKKLDGASLETDGSYIKYAESIVGGEGGAFYAKVPLSDMDSEGEYTCYVGGKAFAGVGKAETYYHAVSATVESAISYLKGAADDNELAKRINEKLDELSLNGGLISGIDAGTFAKLIYSDMTILDENDPVKTQRALMKKALLAAYNGGKKDLVWKNGEFLYKDLIDFSANDKNSANLYGEGFEKILSDSAREAVIDALMNKGFKNEKELQREFLREVIMKGIKNAVTSGSGHISTLLTAENASAAEISIPKYLALTTSAQKTAANNSILAASFSGITELESVIKSAAESAANIDEGQGYVGGGGGGGGSASKKDSSYTMPIAGAAVTEEKQTVFSDLDGAEWAKEAIENLYQKGIVNGVGEKKFAPNNGVTREQFLVMIMRAFGIAPEEGENLFADVTVGAYYADYVNTAKKLGLINGVGENIFGVGKNLSRQDLAVIVKNIVDYLEIQLEKTSDVNFADGDEIAEYAKAAVTELSGAGIINGFEDNTFRPSLYCTRAQSAKIIYELLKGENKQ